MHVFDRYDRSVFDVPCPVDTGRKLNVHKTFNLRPVSTLAICRGFSNLWALSDPYYLAF